MSWQILGKYSNINGAELLHADGQTDVKNQTVAFRNFVKTPNNNGSAAFFIRLGGYSLSVNPLYVKNKVCWFFKNAVSIAAYCLYRF